MTGSPPLLVGAPQTRATWALPAVAVSVVGAPGTTAGVADTSLEDKLSPTELTAVTLK